MASIEKRPDGRYRARWREYANGPQKTRQFARKSDAQLFLDGLRGDLARGVYVDPAGGRILFRDYAEQWRAVQVHRRATVTQVESYLRLHAYPILGNRPIGSIRRSEIQAWVKGRSEILAPTSVELVYRWVSTIFKAAVTDRVIASSPCVRIALPRGTSEEIVPLAVAEIEALADVVPDRYRALVIFAAGMGMRQGECFGLTVDHVDFLRRQVTVDRQLIAVRARVPEFGPPKSQAGFRTIPMPATVGEALAAHLKRYNPGTEGLIFTNSSGDPLQRSSVGDMWRRCVALAKLPKGTSFHDLRHFYASLLIAAGCSVKVIQKRLGHQSAVETLDTYGHLWPDSDDETRNAVDDVLGDIGVPVRDLDGPGQPGAVVAAPGG